MTVTLTYRDAIGHGVIMQDISFGYDYFQAYRHQVFASKIVNTFMTADFNGLGIDKVTQVISRTSDYAAVHFTGGGVEVVTVTGTRPDVGNYDDFEMESIMDRSGHLLSSHGATIVGTKFADLLGTYRSINQDLYGRSGNDTLIGDFENDHLYGGIGRDSLVGDYGDDELTGGSGSDTLSGGGGSDAFIFSDLAGRDHITDWSSEDFFEFFGIMENTNLHMRQISSGILITAGSHIEIVLDGQVLSEVRHDIHIFFMA